MRDEQLINKKYHNLQRNKIMKNTDNFINNEVSNSIISSLDNINISFEKCLEIGFSTKRIYNYLVSRYKNIEYSCMDLSQKILDNHCVLQALQPEVEGCGPLVGAASTDVSTICGRQLLRRCQSWIHFGWQRAPLHCQASCSCSRAQRLRTQFCSDPPFDSTLKVKR